MQAAGFSTHTNCLNKLNAKQFHQEGAVSFLYEGIDTKAQRS